MIMSCFRTDLAMEISEQFNKTNSDLEGIRINVNVDEAESIKTTIVDIIDENGARSMGRDIGKYITIENEGVYDSCNYNSKGLIEELSNRLKDMIKCVIKSNDDMEDVLDKNILVVGLGNEDITPDALGPKVINMINITRNIISREGISAIAPGVMGQTGMEVKEIIHAIVKEIGIKLVIIIDALAARSVYRLNNTIQLTNTGISPGSGVGNNRAEISKKTIGTDVIAIGVPTVVDVYSLVSDVLGKYDIVDDIDKEKQYVKNSFVTSKYVDLMIKDMSQIIAKGINLAIVKKQNKKSNKTDIL